MKEFLKETINKRLFRAKEKLREVKITIGLPDPSDINERLESVQATIYLLFNEGYYSVSQNTTLRRDLCLEAMRLCYLLVENRATSTPAVNALLSLMCFHASRFEARIDQNGGLVLYQDQDTTLWDTELISRGGYFLNCAATGDGITRYHLEAAIAYWHTHQIRPVGDNITSFFLPLLQSTS
jgi:predicted RNA polymerase sigma factor